MFRNLTGIQKALIYCAVTYTLVLAIALTASIIGPTVRVISMLAPAAAVLIVLLVVTRDGFTRAGWAGLGVHRSGRKAWAFAILMPLPVLLFSYTIVWLTGVARPVIPPILGSGATGVINFLISFLIGLVISLIFSLGEEIGWRGYLLPQLLPLGERPAMLLSGLLHGIYHLPLIILTPFYHGEGSRLIIVPLFLLTLTLAGIVYGYLRITTDSVWPAALTHLAFNTYWAYLGAATVAVSPLALEYLAGESGLLTILSLAAVDVWVLVRLSGRLRTAPQPS